MALKPDLSNIEPDFEKLIETPQTFELLINNGLNPNIEGKFHFRCNLVFGAVKFRTLEDVKLVVKKAGSLRLNFTLHTKPLSRCSIRK